jgi:hypothetical protein
VDGSERGGLGLPVPRDRKATGGKALCRVETRGHFFSIDSFILFSRAAVHGGTMPFMRA